MKLSEVSRKFLEWEEENRLFSLEVREFPIYAFFRLQLYEALIFGTDPGVILDRDTSRMKARTDLGQIAKNSFSLLWNFRKLRKPVLLISNTENRRLREEGAVDIYFDQIADQLNRRVSILEFPKLERYHYPNNYNKKIVVKGDFLYALEKLIRLKYDKNLLEEQVSLIVENYAVVYKEVNQKEFAEDALRSQLLAKGERNLNRLYIYKALLKFARPKALILKSSYTPQSQILLFWAKRLGIHSTEVQHGHIYPFHVGYLKPLTKKAGIFPDSIFLWAAYYRGLLSKMGWPEDSLTITGDYTSFQNTADSRAVISKELQSFASRYSRIITIIGQHSINEVFLSYLRTIDKLDDNTGVIFKFHPRFGKSQEAFFSKHLGRKPALHYMLEGDIHSCFKISNLVVGVYSTAVLEAIESQKEVHLINCRESEFFEDFVNSRVVTISPDINTSVNMLKQNEGPPKTLLLREPFNPLLLEQLGQNTK